MKNQIYEVPLIPPDLRREESIVHIADSLDYLNEITNDIFSRISVRVSEYRARLQDLKKRADVAQSKINCIRGSNKATKVFSSYKYPCHETVEEYKSVFSECSVHQIKHSSVKIKSHHPVPDEKVLKEKLQFYNVRSPEEIQKRVIGEEEGLGRLPHSTEMISNLLLFNTAENPYDKYVILDPLGAVTKTRKSLQEEDKDEGIGAAPITITQREQIDHVDRESYFYHPGMGEVPVMDAPLALPDLPGIADDLLYSADLGPSIAPSLPQVSLPDLPAVVPETPTSDMPTPLPPSDGMIPPPPPPPPPPVPSEHIPGPPPPPPPPPPSGLLETVESVPSGDPGTAGGQKAVVTGIPEAIANPGDARASLLDSIRKAGGKPKLRSVNERKQEDKRKKQEEKSSTSGGGDLMSDLVKRLMIRRKGISGANQSESAPPQPQATSPLDKVLIMIPPPPPKDSTDSADVDNTEDEWA